MLAWETRRGSRPALRTLPHFSHLRLHHHLFLCFYHLRIDRSRNFVNSVEYKVQSSLYPTSNAKPVRWQQLYALVQVAFTPVARTRHFTCHSGALFSGSCEPCGQRGRNSPPKTPRMPIVRSSTAAASQVRDGAPGRKPEQLEYTHSNCGTASHVISHFAW